ncbi:unnamed protein product [Gongylonema pulchrum]|uniref:Ribosome biogenesis protein n=1 Tax=Gongylonema pulchrum TaxID=637853 RepID=A0A183D3L0_9BILA|nr:unnamed protein product [Gongylonema pulchrum]
MLSSGMGRLCETDIPAPILDTLSKSQIRHVTIIGRRGPLDVSFTIKELREQITLPGCSFSVNIDDSDLSAANNSLPSLPRPRKRLVELLLDNINSGKKKAERHCQLLFRRVPTKSIRCGLLLYCIGFENVALDGLPADENGQLKMLDTVRVKTTGSGNARVYATGWCAHTPRGIIANTQVCHS